MVKNPWSHTTLHFVNIFRALDKHTTELRLLVDLDQEDGKTPKIDKATGEPRSNKHKVIIRLAKTIAFTTLRSYLECKCDFDNNVLEAISKSSVHSMPAEYSQSCQTSLIT